MNEADTRSCGHCVQLIPALALRCPHCRKWRRDIDRDRQLTYLWSGLSLIPLLIFVFGVSYGWWHAGVTQGFLIISTFSWNAFLGSVSGVLIIASFLGLSAVGSFYYIRVSKKIGSWLWV
jgi:hypothetical protein